MGEDERADRLLALLDAADELATTSQDPTAGMAYAVLFVAAQSLAGGEGWHRDRVRAMFFALNNAERSAPGALKIRLAARVVETAVLMHDAANSGHVAGPWTPAHMLRELACVDAAFDRLKPDDVRSWIEQHTRGRKPGRGGLTTAGVVTNMLIAAKALGSGSSRLSRADVLSRVTDALKKAIT